MARIRELCDPWSLSGRLRPDLQIRRLLVTVKHRLLTRLQSPLPPVIGYAKGASGKLQRHALVTYVAWPFYADEAALKRASHSNGPQALEIAKALNRLGYVVDFVDWQDRTFIPKQHYDVFLGMHDNFGRFLPYLDQHTIKIYYASGSHWRFENAAEDARVRALKDRRGIEMVLRRRLKENNWPDIADAVIVIGNTFVASTYQEHNSRVFPLDNSGVPISSANLSTRDFAQGQRNILAFPSTGLLHKGIDLVLEAFCGLEGFDLWVCGPLHMPEETPFLKAFRRELFHTRNIHPIGWVDVHSEVFQILTDLCGCVVFPSCAEGIATGVLTCMRRGIIPIVSRETGLDTGDFGITLNQSSVACVRDTVIELVQKPLERWTSMAQNAQHVATTRYTLEMFSRNIERILRDILGG